MSGEIRPSVIEGAARHLLAALDQRLQHELERARAEVAMLESQRDEAQARAAAIKANRARTITRLERSRKSLREELAKVREELYQEKRARRLERSAAQAAKIAHEDRLERNFARALKLHASGKCPHVPLIGTAPDFGIVERPKPRPAAEPCANVTGEDCDVKADRSELNYGGLAAAPVDADALAGEFDHRNWCAVNTGSDGDPCNCERRENVRKAIALGRERDALRAELGEAELALRGCEHWNYPDPKTGTTTAEKARTVATNYLRSRLEIQEQRAAREKAEAERDEGMDRQERLLALAEGLLPVWRELAEHSFKRTDGGENRLAVAMANAQPAVDAYFAELERRAALGGQEGEDG